MGNLRIPHALVLLALATSITSQQQPRPTRTLGSLFGSKPTPTPLQQQPKPAVRPLVYQVKYYERGPNGIQTIEVPDARNYGAIDKSGVVVDPHHHQFGNVIVGQPTPIVQQQQQPRVVYYNPLIPPPQQEQQQQYYTIATVGNTQVLVPCSTPNQDQLVYESNVALNVEHPLQSQQQTKQVPVPALRAPQVTTQQQQQVQQGPLVREQVVAAAAELSTYGNIPGSGVVGAGINTVPYGYYYYYYIPPTPQQQQVPSQQQQQPVVQQVVQQQPQIIPQYYNPYTRIIPQHQPQVLPVVISGVPNYQNYFGGVTTPLVYTPHHHHHQIVPQASTVIKEQRPQQTQPQQQQQQQTSQQRVVQGTKVEGQHK